MFLSKNACKRPFANFKFVFDSVITNFLYKLHTFVNRRLNLYQTNLAFDKASMVKMKMVYKIFNYFLRKNNYWKFVAYQEIK